MNKRPVETVLGIVVIIVAAFFLVFTYRVSDLQMVRGYELNARFLKVGGLNTGSDVRINGIKVGTVVSQKLDQEDFTANVRLSISNDVRLPVDSVAIIMGDGLMGDRFINIQPGRSTEFLAHNDRIVNTRDFKTIEDMVGEIIFMVTDSGSN